MKSANLGWACILYLAGLAVVYKGKYERRNQRNQRVTQRQLQVIKSIQGSLRSRPIIRGRRSQQVKRLRTKDVWVGPRDLNAPFASVEKPGDIKKKEEF